jgi:hypothetical protein
MCSCALPYPFVRASAQRCRSCPHDLQAAQAAIASACSCALLWQRQWDGAPGRNSIPSWYMPCKVSAEPSRAPTREGRAEQLVWSAPWCVSRHVHMWHLSRTLRVKYVGMPAIRCGPQRSASDTTAKSIHACWHACSSARATTACRYRHSCSLMCRHTCLIRCADVNGHGTTRAWKYVHMA